MFKYALNGLVLLSREKNWGIHILIAIVVMTMAAVIGVNGVEWAVIIIMVSIVIITEAFNTVIEKICDIIEPRFSKDIGDLKDMSAGLVLVCAVSSVIVGIIIFGPYLIRTWFFS